MSHVLTPSARVSALSSPAKCVKCVHACLLALTKRSAQPNLKKERKEGIQFLRPQVLRCAGTSTQHVVAVTLSTAAATVLIALSRLLEECLAQPLLHTPAAAPTLSPVAAVAVLTPCVAGGLALGTFLSLGGASFRGALVGSIQWWPLLLSCCSAFGALLRSGGAECNTRCCAIAGELML